jgi:hypothetical protein
MMHRAGRPGPAGADAGVLGRKQPTERTREQEQARERVRARAPAPVRVRVRVRAWLGWTLRGWAVPPGPEKVSNRTDSTSCPTGMQSVGAQAMPSRARSPRPQRTGDCDDRGGRQGTEQGPGGWGERREMIGLGVGRKGWGVVRRRPCRLHRHGALFIGRGPQGRHDSDACALSVACAESWLLGAGAGQQASARVGTHALAHCLGAPRQ